MSGTPPSSSGTIAVSITEGRAIRDLFYNGLIDHFRAAGYRTLIFTEATRTPAFTQEWGAPDVTFAPLEQYDGSRHTDAAYLARRRVAGTGNRALLNAWLGFEMSRWYRPKASYREILEQHKPSLLLNTNALFYTEAHLVTTARSLGIPTLGVVRSWDNVHKGLKTRPDEIAVWNEVNYQEVLSLEGYEAERVHIIGSPQFDPYFAADTLQPREEFAARFGFDPARPILLFATLGQFRPGFDETCWMDVLLRLLDEGAIPGRPQVLLRLHPWSRYEYFEKYGKHPDVRISYATRYHAALGWYMTREEVVEVANMLKHAAVVITPGSTISLEAALFDTPTLVPLFHPYQPERAKVFFNTRVLGRHFGRLEKEKLVPILREEAEFAPAIRRCIEEPEWNREARAAIVRDYAHFTDGRSTERLAELALRLARKSRPLTTG